MLDSDCHTRKTYDTSKKWQLENNVFPVLVPLFSLSLIIVLCAKGNDTLYLMGHNVNEIQFLLQTKWHLSEKLRLMLSIRIIRL